MRRSRPAALGGLLATLVLALAACGGGSASPADGDEDGGDTGETVSLSGGAFAPSSLTIPVGTTVTFTDTAGHTVTEGSDGEAVEDPLVDEEGSAEPIVVSFDEAGTFNITCRIHPAMNMTITVEG
ncbi:MAG: amidase [Chloroflexi bacterium]|nr:amidase [Chloroflexota bacterium]